MKLNLPNLGLGLGLRSQHFNHITEHWPKVDWFEVISENFMDSFGRPRHILRQVSERYPVVMHGVSMSIGSTDPIDFTYLKRLKSLAREIQPAWISDHLCWTGVLTINSHDLLPVPLNEESLKHVCNRIRVVQDYLERPLILENPSTYLEFQHSTMPEWKFMNYMAAETSCGLLLDVNNVYVSAFNNDFDPVEYLRNIHPENVVQMHLAGHQHCGDYIIDTHDREVTEHVWELFRLAWQRTGGVSTLLEWDGDIPAFDVYHAEMLKAKNFMHGASIFTKTPEHITDVENVVSNPINFIVSDVAKDLAK